MAASVAPLRNGISPSVHQSHEALQYEKILQIRQEVFAGKHPRLSLPAPAPALQPFSQSHLAIPASISASASPSRRVTAQPGHDQPTPSSHNPMNVSEFDPVLLTKSDDLLRAENQLKRQRLEKQLKEQFEHKRLDARKRPAPAEAKPDFDLQALFSRVSELSKEFAKGEASGSESIDENSFYSSRAPDSVEEGQNSSGEDAEEGEADEPLGPRVSAVMGSPLRPDRGDNSTNVESVDSTKQDLPIVPNAMDMDDEEEEGEYSPPEATENYSLPANDISQPMQDSRDPRSRPLRRYSETDDNGRRPPSPYEGNMRVVRNHITSPVAPQPSRVSPLAVAKAPSISQNARQQRAARRDARRDSPPSPDDSQPSKKRKRLERQQDRQQKRSRRNGGYSPDAFIKEENVSPPPFHDVQPLGSGKLRPTGTERPIIIHDDEPIQESRYMPPPERYVESPMRLLPRQVEQLMPQSEPRVLSRSSVRPVRDEQNLRRVASLHNMRAEPIRDHTDPYVGSPTRARAASYARLGSPAPMGALPGQLREVVMDYERAPPEARVARTPAPIYREVYDDGEGGLRYVEPMPPPPLVERIVVDQYGRKLREIIQSEPAPLPRAMSVRRSAVEPQYEDYHSVRAGSVLLDAAPERTYTSDMPPPQASYRRQPEPIRGSVMPGGHHRDYVDALPGSGRAASVQLVDRRPAQEYYADERTEYHEPVRMASVRPPTTRYEAAPPPVDMISRGQSVRPPIGREGSVFIDDRTGARHEYVPAESVRYRAVEPEKRYIDAHGREIIALDRSMDGRARLVERY